MNKIITIATHVGKFISKNSSTILTSIGVAGVVGTAVLASAGTVKAVKTVEITENNEELTKKEFVKLCWKHYIPAVLAGSASIACIIGANHINAKHIAALAGLYSLSETALKEYRDKIVEIVGQTKATKIHDAVMTDKVVQNPVGNREVIFTGKGDTLFYDALSGRYFRSDIETVRRAQNDINARIFQSDTNATVNELYLELGLNEIDLGKYVGWNAQHPLECKFTSGLNDSEAYIVLYFNKDPIEIMPF